MHLQPLYPVAASKNLVDAALEAPDLMMGCLFVGLHGLQFGREGRCPVVLPQDSFEGEICFMSKAPLACNTCTRPSMNPTFVPSWR